MDKRQRRFAIAGLVVVVLLYAALAAGPVLRAGRRSVDGAHALVIGVGTEAGSKTRPGRRYAQVELEDGTRRTVEVAGGVAVRPGDVATLQDVPRGNPRLVAVVARK